jgi:hypothetical protein
MTKYTEIHVWAMVGKERVWKCDSIHHDYVTARRVFDALRRKTATRAVVLVDFKGRPLDVYASARLDRTVLPYE